METVVWGGKTRTKSKCDNCRECGKEFYHFPWDKQEYCSTKCYYNRLKVRVGCTTCGKEVLKSKSVINRNSENYCSRECYDSRRKENLKRLKRETKHYNDLLTGASCACGVSESYLLQIHHIDGNHNNNDPSNHEIVCANCHIKRHLKKRNKDGKLVYSPKSLTDKELLKTL